MPTEMYEPTSEKAREDLLKFKKAERKRIEESILERQKDRVVVKEVEVKKVEVKKAVKKIAKKTIKKKKKK